jgi:hypothetical protein
MESLAAQVRQARQRVDREAGRAHQLALDGKAAEAVVAHLEEQAERYAKTAAVLTTIGEQAQEDARSRFEMLATHALREIFGSELLFRLVAGESGGQATLEPVIQSSHDGVITETPVLEARGGGLAAVTGFVMRLVMLLLKPGTRKILFLDESFAHVSVAYKAAVAEFLRDIADKAGVQIVMVTHDQVFAQYADARIRFARGADGRTRVTEGEPELWLPD